MHTRWRPLSMPTSPISCTCAAVLYAQKRLSLDRLYGTSGPGAKRGHQRSRCEVGKRSSPSIRQQMSYIPGGQGRSAWGSIDIFAE